MQDICYDYASENGLNTIQQRNCLLAEDGEMGVAITAMEIQFTDTKVGDLNCGATSTHGLICLRILLREPFVNWAFLVLPVKISRLLIFHN